MKKGVLVTLPQSDDVTEYLTAFSNPVIDEISKQGIAVKVLRKSEVIRTNFESAIKSFDYSVVFFNGHGAIDCITGHKEEKIVVSGENDDILSGRIVYARSCWAAEGLGKMITKKNELGCFIGYNIPFMFLYDTTRISNPIKDHIAKIFFETTNIIPISIAKGKTSGRAYESSNNAILKAIRKALLKKDKDSESIAEALWNNYSGQVLLGNSEATL